MPWFYSTILQLQLINLNQLILSLASPDLLVWSISNGLCNIFLEKNKITTHKQKKSRSPSSKPEKTQLANLQCLTSSNSLFLPCHHQPLNTVRGLLYVWSDMGYDLLQFHCSFSRYFFPFIINLRIFFSFSPMVNLSHWVQCNSWTTRYHEIPPKYSML